MPRLIAGPTVIEAAGTKPKVIREFIGLVNSETEEMSIAHMISPAGWTEPRQTPEFREVTVVLAGTLQVEHAGGTDLVRTGQAIICEPGEWVRYSTPAADGAEYIAICQPAFSPATVHRES